MRRLEEILGDRLTDPDARFAIEVVLRAMWLRDHAAVEKRAPADNQGTSDRRLISN
ncbi:hypothetical protein ETD83_17380 [Actinomadura soli]|uniref:Uncharacterized protein n=1 Tax=Actinomadura soli TaxID=2508997 RepID=A0A5C4JC56_9ACTN|nr:hypothetical protein ETD83_17380 [Actinomadura soli]